MARSCLEPWAGNPEAAEQRCPACRMEARQPVCQGFGELKPTRVPQARLMLSPTVVSWGLPYCQNDLGFSCRERRGAEERQDGSCRPSFWSPAGAWEITARSPEQGNRE